MEIDAKTPEKLASEEAPKPKIVRNRDIDRAAKQLADDHVLPLPPGKTLTFDQMQEWFGLLTPAMWSHVAVYLYRLRPKIRRQLKDPNSPNYIDCIGEPFNMDYLIGRHGGGRYQIQAADSEGKKGSESNFLFKCFFDINEVQYPPILNYEELDLTAKENKTYIEWLQNKGILNNKGEVITQPGNQPPASTANNLSAKDILDILNFAQNMNRDQQAAFRAQFATPDSLGKSVGDILLEKMRQDDPGKDWDRMMTFMEKINKPDNSLGPIIQILQSQITSANEQRKTDMEMWKFMMESQRREQSPRNQIAEFRDMIGLAREIIGSGNGRRSGWDTGLEIAREVVLPGIQTIGNVVSNIMSLRGNGTPATGQPPARPAPPAGPFDPYRNPQAARQYASSMAQQPQPQPAPGQAPAPPPQPQPQPADAEAQLLQLLQSYGGLIQNHMNHNTPGYDFADYVVGLLGTGVHAQICGPGEETLATVMMRIPELAMFGETRIRTFVNEFVHYEEYIMQAAAGEEEPAEEEGPTVEMPAFHKPMQPATTSASKESRT